MNIVTAAVARAGARLARWRSDRPFHPDGCVLVGELVVDDADSALGRAWGPGSSPTLARFSRSIGLDRSVPDILGAALRVTRPSGAHVDLLMVTTLGPGPGALLLGPARTWTSRPYSTLMPFVVDGSWRLLGLRSDGVSLSDGDPDSLAAGVEASPVTFRVVERGLGPWRDVGRLVLTEHHPEAAVVRFDPVTNADSTVHPAPILRSVRHAAYWGAQHPDRALEERDT